ncbi:MAG: terminase small subunit [Candidatus Marinimicrobia bacterium]|nr:terminase small subunit [Candidatus Neomarinimicrobiota bacterium]
MTAKRGRKTDKLTLKQELYCRAYINNGGNATAAYRQAFAPEKASDKTIGRQAHTLLHTPKISAMIEKLKRQALKAQEWNPEALTAEITRLLGEAKDRGDRKEQRMLIELLGKWLGLDKTQDVKVATIIMQDNYGDGD